MTDPQQTSHPERSGAAAEVVEAVASTLSTGPWIYEAGVVVDGYAVSATHGYVDFVSRTMESETQALAQDPQGNLVQEKSASFLDGTDVYVEAPPSGTGEPEWVTFPTSGIAASQAWLLFWLLGTVDAREVPDPSGAAEAGSTKRFFEVRVERPAIVPGAPGPWRDVVRAGLEDSMLSGEPGPFFAVVGLEAGAVGSVTMTLEDVTLPGLTEAGAVHAATLAHVLNLLPSEPRAVEFPPGARTL